MELVPPRQRDYDVFSKSRCPEDSNMDSRRRNPCHCTHLFGGCISIHTGAPKLPEIWGFVAWLLLTDLLRTRSRRELLAQGAIGLNYIFHKYLSINAVHHKFSSFSATKMWVKTRVQPAVREKRNPTPNGVVPEPEGRWWRSAPSKCGF